MSLESYSPYLRESEADPLKHRTLSLTPWTVQNIVYELIVNHYMTNDPAASGYVFTQRYDPDFRKSSIHIAIANNWEANTPEKRPAIFIERGDASFNNPTLHQGVALNVKESEYQKLSLTSMDINIGCIAKGVGFTEQLSEFTRSPFRYFQEQIRRDFGFRKFKLANVSKPQLYVESQDNFIVLLTLQTAFDDNWIVAGDDLKIKTIPRIIFDTLTSKPFTNQ